MAKKIMNSDIYNLSGLVNDIKHEFIPEETEETLAVGTYGYFGAIESKRLQSQVIMTGELCNESFPSRARLERNVITHAIMNNIENINALPAKMDVILGVRQKDIIDLMEDDTFTLIKIYVSLSIIITDGALIYGLIISEDGFSLVILYCAVYTCSLPAIVILLIIISYSR